ncbi:hypothetical protein Tco_0408094 [Tanacetum coccineum]
MYDEKLLLRQLSHSRTTAKPELSRSRAIAELQLNRVAAEPSRSQVAPFIAETTNEEPIDYKNSKNYGKESDERRCYGTHFQNESGKPVFGPSMIFQLKVFGAGKSGKATTHAPCNEITSYGVTTTLLAQKYYRSYNRALAYSLAALSRNLMQRTWQKLKKKQSIMRSLWYINAIYFIPLNAAEFQHSGLIERCIMIKSKKFWSSLISATVRNNQYILATQVTQVFYLQDLARQPRGWKVIKHVYHRDVAESDQDVIHGSSSSHVTLSVGLTNLEHTDLSINVQSTEVDTPLVNDDNANANKDNADFINNEDDVVAHVLDDDVVVSDDDEVNPSTNVEEIACLAPRSHGGDASGSLLRIETGNASLRKAFRHNNQQPLTLGFDYDDLGTFHPIGDYASMLNSLMGETIRPLPLACEWEEFQLRLKGYFPYTRGVEKLKNAVKPREEHDTIHQGDNNIIAQGEATNIKSIERASPRTSSDDVEEDASNSKNGDPI